MKKNVLAKTILIGLAVLAGVCFTSCASIPKKMKAGDTLVIGRVVVQSSGYEDEGYGDFNKTLKEGIEITITDEITKQEKLVRTGKDGYFVIKGLKPHGSYKMSKVQINAAGNAGSGKLWVNLSHSEVFIPYENNVVNIGCTTFIFDGKRGTVNYETKDHYKIRTYFKEISEESEWKDAAIYDQCGY